MAIRLSQTEKQARAWKRLVDRFERSYTPEPMSGCFLWLGNVREMHGYLLARFCWEAHWEIAPRACWRLKVGPIPAGAHVLHRCDNSLCVNENHLYLGDNTQNVRDRENRNRGWTGRIDHMREIRKMVSPRFGERHSRARLSWNDITEIRNSTEMGIVLAARYNVSPPHISYIRSGKFWPESQRPKKDISK